MPSNWVPFHFESNQSWGLCNSQEDWELVKANYLEYWADHGGLDLEKVYVNRYIDINDMISGKRGWSFGLRFEYDGTYTLAEFARDNNMTL